MNKYSIIIPIHNEKRYIPTLLKELKFYLDKGHQVIIIDDGSNDGSTNILKGYNDIKLILFTDNKGKGHALRSGIKEAVNDRIVIYDGDMELNPSDILKLMILDKSSGIKSVMGYRFKVFNPFKSSFDWGNFMFTSFFNILFKSSHKDILCCAKAFYAQDIKNYSIKSKGFDIDVELSSILTIMNKKGLIPQVAINYSRRNFQEGKKLKVFDGWKILWRMIKMIKFL